MNWLVRSVEVRRRTRYEVLRVNSGLEEYRVWLLGSCYIDDLLHRVQTVTAGSSPVTVYGNRFVWPRVRAGYHGESGQRGCVRVLRFSSASTGEVAESLLNADDTSRVLRSLFKLRRGRLDSRACAKATAILRKHRGCAAVTLGVASFRDATILGSAIGYLWSIT
jgi:hypothetical protein